MLRDLVARTSPHQFLCIPENFYDMRVYLIYLEIALSKYSKMPVFQHLKVDVGINLYVFVLIDFLGIKT